MKCWNGDHDELRRGDFIYRGAAGRGMGVSGASWTSVPPRRQESSLHDSRTLQRCRNQPSPGRSARSSRWRSQSSQLQKRCPRVLQKRCSRVLRKRLQELPASKPSCRNPGTSWSGNRTEFANMSL